MIALAIIAGYATVGLFLARRWFGAIRPFREPIKCRWDYGGHEHIGSCYERVDTIGTQGEATFIALFAGLFWPVVWPAVLVGPRLKRWFTRSSPDLPEEIAAKIARMEKDLNL